jgi:hypothetical protein
MSAPGVRNLTIVHRDDYSHTITIVDSDSVAINLTGRTYAAEIRSAPSTAGTADATFTVSLTNLATGIVVISLTDTQTDALVPGLPYFWDLQETVTATTFTTTVLAGKVTVPQDVTA